MLKYIPENKLLASILAKFERKFVYSYNFRSVIIIHSNQQLFEKQLVLGNQRTIIQLHRKLKRENRTNEIKGLAYMFEKITLSAGQTHCRVVNSGVNEHKINWKILFSHLPKP